jgi:hypothetical protein
MSESGNKKENNKNTQENTSKKGLLRKWVEKIDRKMEERSRNLGCCKDKGCC